MNKGVTVIKTNVKGILGVLLKKIFFLIISSGVLALGFQLKLYVQNKLGVTGNIFTADIVGMVSMILTYIVLGILALFFIIAACKFLSVFYELGRETTIDFQQERIVIKKYDFPFEKEISEKKFNRIVGVDINQKSIERSVNCGNVCIEYLVLSKNDSKLRAIEVPYVENPEQIKRILLEE
jgi:hypothetical protein